jgi:membrane fusion protein (multidrug efflux system)
MKPVRTSLAVFCSVIIMVAFFNGCKETKKESAHGVKPAADTTAIKVIVADVKEGAFEDWGTYSADLRGLEDANLAAPSQGGRVNSIKPVGTYVKAGEALCDIESEKYEAALQAAQAQVDVAKGDLERAKINVEKGSLGRSALDAANLAYQNARMGRATAKRAYEDCRCEAPFDGVLVSRSIDRFQTVSGGMPTVRLSKLNQLEAVIAISETEAFSFSEGMKTEFRLLQNQEQVYIGKITSIDRAVDTRSRTITARIVLANPSGLLKPGMVGRARILRKNYQKSIVIPATALLRLQNGTSVMVVENGVAKQHLVDIAVSNGDSVMIRSGLTAGDKLIISGAFQVSEGTKVKY